MTEEKPNQKMSLGAARTALHVADGIIKGLSRQVEADKKVERKRWTHGKY